MQLKRIYLAASLLIATMGSAAAQSNISIGVPNWPGARGIAAILKATIEKELGAKASTVSGTNPVIYKAMDEGKGDIDVHPDSWMPNQANFRAEYVDQKKSVTLNKGPYTGKQGICTPKYVQDKYGVKSIFDLAKPEIIKAFDANGRGKGEVWLGATGWAITNILKVQARDYGWAPLYEESNIDETLFYGKLDDYYRQQKPILFHCYTPHWTSFKYQLVMLEEPVNSADCYKMVQPQQDPDWFNKSKITCAIADANVYVAYSKSLETRAPAVAKLLANVSFTAAQMNEISDAIAVKKINEDTYAAGWVASNEAVVKRWLGTGN